MIRDMLQKFKDAMIRFLSGRYGSDKLNLALLGGALALMILGAVGRRSWLSVCSLLAYVPLIWSIFRMYSRNVEARRRENAAFLHFFSRLKDREHCYFHCPGCRQTVRVPRGRGKISIRCPKCGMQFIKKT